MYGSLAFIFVAGLCGLVVGSFLNVVIYRLPRIMEREWHAQAAELRGEPAPPGERFNLAVPRSRCPHCAHPIGLVENIPLLSYLMLRGRCRHCQAPIGRRYPIVEAAAAVLAMLSAWHFGFSLATLGALFFVWTMLALAAIDFDCQLLPDDLTLPLLWLGLLFNLDGHFTDLHSAVLGAIGGYLLLWSVYWLFRLITGKEGMGHGDFKLLAAIGAWVGWQLLPLTILLSSLSGALVGLALILFAGHGRNVPIPFGPYLAAAGVIALFWGERISATWLPVL